MAVNSAIGKGFNKLAPIYDLAVKLVFGNKLWQLQNEILVDLSAGENCLIIGGGSGKILELAIEQNLASHFFYAELSDKMIARTKHRLANTRSTISYSNDWNFWNNQSFDYIILPFVLDCYKADTIELMLTKLSKQLSERGKIVFVDFAKTPNPVQSLFIKLLYAFFGVFTKIEATQLAPFRQIFESSGFKFVSEKNLYDRWIQAIVWIKTDAIE